MLVDQVAAAIAVEREGRVDRVRLAGREGVGEDPSRTGSRLESAGAPAAVDEEVFDRSLADDLV